MRGSALPAPLVAAPAPAGEALTLATLLHRNAVEAGRAVAMREKDLGIWQEYTWRAYLDAALETAAGLDALGFAEGQALIVVGDNRPNLYFGMLGACLAGGFPTPVFPDAAPDEVLAIVRQSGARFALAEDQEQVDKLLDLRKRLPQLEIILYDDPRGLSSNPAPGLMSYEEVRASGRRRLAGDPGLADALVHRARPDHAAVLLHSSGTTGAPKGIILEHRQVLAAVRNAQAAGYFERGEEIVAYLPLAWVGDFVFSVAAAIVLRFTVNVPERQETVLENLREIAPTLYFAPPRSWDLMLTRVQVRMQESSRLKRWLWDHLMRRAIAAERARFEGRPTGLWTRLVGAAGEVVAAGPVKDYLGLSRVRRAYTAGEAIGEDTFVFFRALGLNLKQFYGQTENSALTAAQADDAVRLHTVGTPLPGVEVRIDASGEILLRAASLFRGYHGNAEATERAMAGGWFHTGDAGYLEPDGHLVILGRVEDVVETAGGHRFVPQYVENRLKFSPFVREAAVLGAGRPCLAAIVCIDVEAVGHWAEQRGITYTSYADLSQKPEVVDLVADTVRHVNGLLPKELAVRRFVNLHKEFDPDDGELTRTRKLRRRVIEDRYGQVVEAMYGGRGSVDVEAVVTYETGETGTLRRVLAIREVE